MNIIVGLGNPGEKYSQTRHNIGFSVVEKLARELEGKSLTWNDDTKHKASLARWDKGILLKPLTYMNLSGEAVRSVMEYYKIPPQNLYVIHDDLDLPLGKIRIRKGGASAGHNGVQSIIDHLKTDDFVRFRLGVGRGKEDIHKDTDQHLKRSSVISFVLSRFHDREAGDMRKLIATCADAVIMALDDGMEKAMNRYN